MNKLELSILVIGFAVVMACGTFAGYIHARDTIQPTSPVTVQETKTVEIPVEIIKEVEVIKEVPRELREFESSDELKEWLEQDDTDKYEIMRLVIDSNMSGTFTGGGCCEDYAMHLQESALSDGYIVSFSTINWNEYNALFTEKQCSLGEKHALNLTIIRNKVYLIEPQTDEWHHVYDLD